MQDALPGRDASHQRIHAGLTGRFICRRATHGLIGSETETRRHDADHSSLNAVELQRLPDERRIGASSRQSASLSTATRSTPCASSTDVKPATDAWRDAKDVEQLGAGGNPGDESRWGRFNFDGDVFRAGTRRRPENPVHCGRSEDELSALPRIVCPKHRELIVARIRKRIDEERSNDSGDRRHSADAEGEREDGEELYMSGACGGAAARSGLQRSRVP